MIALYTGPQRDILRRAMEAWGHASQVEMVVEECAELIAAMKRFERGRVGPEAIADEVADVLITLGYVIEAVGEDAVERALAAKWKRLVQRIEEAEAKAVAS